MDVIVESYCAAERVLGRHFRELVPEHTDNDNLAKELTKEVLSRRRDGNE